MSEKQENDDGTLKLRRMSSFEIEKPFFSDNENDEVKKDPTIVDLPLPKNANYDSRFLNLKQVLVYLIVLLFSFVLR